MLGHLLHGQSLATTLTLDVMNALRFARHIARAPVLLTLLSGLGSLAAQAQTPAAPPVACAQVQNVIQLSATGQVEVVQDWLTMTLVATREGADAAGVQAQLRQALDAALAQVQPSAQAALLQVQTGGFSVHPRYDRNGKIGGWQGRAELLLSGRDFARITQAAARAGNMAIGQMAFSLSSAERSRVQAEAQTQAITRFRSRAAEIARQFGFAGYNLREVSVSGDADVPAPRMVAAMAKGLQMEAADVPVPVEPGRTTVQVTVSGTVQAH